MKGRRLRMAALVLLSCWGRSASHAPALVRRVPHLRSASASTSVHIRSTSTSTTTHVGVWQRAVHPRCDAAMADDGAAAQRRTIICCYGALCSLICVKAVVAQALPLMLLELQAQPELVASTLSTVAAGSAALEFALLPAVAALSDTHGRRPLLLALPLLTVLLRVMVVCRPTLQTLILSRVVVGALVNYFDLFVAVTAADLFADDAEARPPTY
jgi:hypothetical protein